MAKIPFNDIVDVQTCSGGSLGPMEPVTISVNGETKLWRKKISHVEVIDSHHPNRLPSKGDNIGFTLIFGNDGEISCATNNKIATVEDTLEVAEPINLKLLSLSLSCDYELWVSCVKPSLPKFQPCKITPGAILPGGYTYILQLRKKVNKCYTPFFDIPSDYIASVSMLFQIEFPVCEECHDDCI